MNPLRGEKEEDDLRTLGGQAAQKGKGSSSRGAHCRRRQRPGMGSQGPAPGEFVSILNPSTFMRPDSSWHNILT